METHIFLPIRNNSSVTNNKKHQEELQMAKNYSSDASNQNKTNTANETSKNAKNYGNKNTKNTFTKNTTSKSSSNMDDETEKY